PSRTSQGFPVCCRCVSPGRVLQQPEPPAGVTERMSARRVVQRRWVTALLLPLLWVGVSCRVHPAGGERAPAGVPHEYVEVHMGTRVHIALHASSRAVADRAARAAYDRVAGLEDIFSDYRPQSELNRIGSSAGT